jgi:hypothetical protein
MQRFGFFATLTISLFCLMVAPEVVGQSSPLPRVTINSSAVSFQASLYPDYYLNNSPNADMRWVANNDSLIRAFWQFQGDSVLAKLALLGGISWVEPSFDIYLLRFYPSAGESNPLIIPLGGQLRGVAIEAPPDRAGLLFSIIYQLAQRLIAQTQLSGSNVSQPVANHPLLQAGPFRRDNLAILLTLAVAPLFIGPESTLAVYTSPSWRVRTPGRQVFEEQIQGKWLVTAQKPLAQWLKDEPYDSPLVEMTRPLRAADDDNSEVVVTSMAGLPPKGLLGFTVKTSNGKFEVDKIDPNRAGFASGLRSGDVISQVDAKRVASVKELFERMLAGLDGGASTLTVFRGGKLTTVIIRRQ